MSFIQGLMKSLIDKGSRKSFTSTLVTKIVQKQYHNKFQQKQRFDAVVLKSELVNKPAVTPSDSSASGASFASSTSIYKAYVRPLDIHDMLVPEPCKFKDKASIEYCVSLHPIAMSENILEDGVNNIVLNPGDIVSCYYLKGPDNPQGMVGLRFKSHRVSKGKKADHKRFAECLSKTKYDDLVEYGDKSRRPVKPPPSRDRTPKSGIAAMIVEENKKTIKVDMSKHKWTKGSRIVFLYPNIPTFLDQLVIAMEENDKKLVAAGKKALKIKVHVNSGYRGPASQARVVCNNYRNTKITSQPNKDDSKYWKTKRGKKTFRKTLFDKHVEYYEFYAKKGYPKNLKVYPEGTRNVYIKNDCKNMAAIVQFETKSLAAAIKRDPNTKRHGTGWSIDIRTSDINEKKRQAYKKVIESLGAHVLHEKAPEHFHVTLKDWKPPES